MTNKLAIDLCTDTAPRDRSDFSQRRVLRPRDRVEESLSVSYIKQATVYPRQIKGDKAAANGEPLPGRQPRPPGRIRNTFTSRTNKVQRWLPAPVGIPCPVRLPNGIETPTLSPLSPPLPFPLPLSLSTLHSLLSYETAGFRSLFPRPRALFLREGQSCPTEEEGIRGMRPRWIKNILLPRLSLIFHSRAAVVLDVRNAREEGELLTPARDSSRSRVATDVRRIPRERSIRISSGRSRR